LDEWPGVVLGRSHELRLAELSMEHAKLQAQRAAQDRWPDPAVGVRVLNERDGDEQAIGLSVLMPLPSRHRSARAAEARFEARAAEARLDATRRELEELAAQDVAEVRASLAAWDALQVAAQNATQHLQRAQRAYELGQVGLSEMLMSLRSATTTIHEERLARLDAHEALARLSIDAHELWASSESGHHHE
jgi:outer membrane protein TolC